MWVFVCLYILRRRLSANARNVTVFTDLSAYTRSYNAYATIIVPQIHWAQPIIMHEYLNTDTKKGKKRCKKWRRTVTRAHEHAHALHSICFLSIFMCECVPFFFSLARNWINSLELPFYVRFALYNNVYIFFMSIRNCSMPTLAPWL